MNIWNILVGVGVVYLIGAFITFSCMWWYMLRSKEWNSKGASPDQLMLVAALGACLWFIVVPLAYLFNYDPEEDED